METKPFNAVDYITSEEDRIDLIADAVGGGHAGYLQAARSVVKVSVEREVKITPVEWEETVHGLWRVGHSAPAGKWFAAREREPYFCVTGRDRQSAERRAGEAFESYVNLMKERD